MGSSSKQAVARLLGLRSVVKGQRSGVMRSGRWVVAELLGLGPQARGNTQKATGRVSEQRTAGRQQAGMAEPRRLCT